MTPALGTRLGFGRRPSARLNVGLRSLSLLSDDAPAHTLALEASGLEPVCEGVRTLLTENGRLVTDVLLACAWSRILLLPWISQLAREEHWRNYAAARFEELHGDDAAHWEIRVARDLPGNGRMAVAWPKRLRDELAGFKQVNSVQVGVLKHLGNLLAQRQSFSGCVIELDEDGAGFLLLLDGVVNRARWCRYDDAEALASAVHNEWASVLAANDKPADLCPSLAVTPPAVEAGSPRAAAIYELGVRLGVQEGFSLPEYP